MFKNDVLKDYGWDKYLTKINNEKDVATKVQKKGAKLNIILK